MNEQDEFKTVRVLYWDPSLDGFIHKNMSLCATPNPWNPRFGGDIDNLRSLHPFMSSQADKYYKYTNPSTRAHLYGIWDDRNNPVKYPLGGGYMKMRHIELIEKAWKNLGKDSFMVVYQYQERRLPAKHVLEDLDRDSPVYRLFMKLLSEDAKKEYEMYQYMALARIHNMNAVRMGRDAARDDIAFLRAILDSVQRAENARVTDAMTRDELLLEINSNNDAKEKYEKTLALSTEQPHDVDFD